jgi:serine-type D-Ala-D-Ala carboxypeptidase (penicillin-binding protein 5/6)
MLLGAPEGRAATAGHGAGPMAVRAGQVPANRRDHFHCLHRFRDVERRALEHTTVPVSMRKRGLIAALVIVVAGGVAGALLQSEYAVLGTGGTDAGSPGDRTTGGGAVESDRGAAAAARSGRSRARTAPAWSPFVLRRPAGRPPVQVGFARQPRAGILFDVDSGEVLWQRYPGRRLPIASLTKMLTALIIAERHRPGERVAITQEALAYEGSGVGVLPQGKRVKLEKMLNGLLLVSGNDAAIALAQHDAGSVKRFVRRMNSWRARLGLRCSRFTSPHGLQDNGNYACVRDLAALARAALANRRVRKIVGASYARFRFPVKGRFLDLYNNNPFIRARRPGITGVKTGYTNDAGRCYVITARRGGRHLGVVLLDTPNPLDQVTALLQAGARRG